MTSYTAPLQDIEFSLYEIAGLDSITDIPKYTDSTEDVVTAILDAAASFTQGVLSPLNQLGDQQGVKVIEGNVVTPTGFADAYQQYIAGGWPSLPIASSSGGQGLPNLINAATMEMVMGANLAFSLCPMLTQGAIKTIEAYGNDHIKHTFLPKMTSGVWTGAMDLTESQAGSDLSAVNTQATYDGTHYRITGQKIFISWGDHDMADNVIHLVLARITDSPNGINGLSLFLVPKFLIEQDGSLGARNDITTVSTEEKLGLHGSPTCVIAYGDNEGAVGYLLGEKNKGLSCMFTMMNHARINVGMQGLGLAERAFQQGAAYSLERKQGGKAIRQYPDVERMVMLMQTGCSAMRSIIYLAIGLTDLSESTDENTASSANKRLQLLTPIVKSWCTDLTQEITSLNIQIHGGTGFIEESGAPQYYRDARILPIYEGTNAIQANDFISRKFLLDNGTELEQLFDEMTTDIQKFSELPELSLDANQLSNALGLAQECANLVKKTHFQGKDWRIVACYFLDLNAYCISAWLMCKKAIISHHQQETYGSRFSKRQLENSRFFINHYLPRSHALATSIKNILN
mgnify:CR=1 FL=1